MRISLAALVARFALAWFGLAGTCTAAPIYAISSSDEGHRAQQDLYVVNAITGALTQIGPVADGPSRLALESLAFAPGLGLYGVGSGALYQINTNSGQATEIGPSGLTLMALVYGPNGVLYGAAGDRLYSVDAATGAATLIGSGHDGSIESLEFDALGNLYAAVQGLGGDSLYRIDPATGAGTRVGPIGFHDVEGLAFVNGTMYGFTENGLELSINLANGFGHFVRDVGVGFEATAVDPPDTPEPATIWLTGAALAALLGSRRPASG